MEIYESKEMKEKKPHKITRRTKKEACLYSIIQNAAKTAPTQPTSRRTEKRLKIYIF